MITYRIQFVATCPLCQHPDRLDMHRMGKSHVDWIRGLEPMNELPNWHCKNCKQKVTAKLSGVRTEQVGKY
jgi:transposase-like protein